MRLQVDRSVFLGSLSHALSVVEKRTTVPVLTHVLLTASDNKLSLAATDIDIALLESMEIQVSESGSVAVPAQPLHDIVKKLPDKSVLQLFIENNQLHIHAGRSQFKLPTLSGEDFPQIDQAPITHSWQLTPATFRMLIEQTRFAMSTEEKRYHLNGICFHTADKSLFADVEGKFLRAISTDLHRLACIEEVFESNFQDMPDFIISRKTINEMHRLLEDISEPVDFSLSESRIEFAYKRGDVTGVLSARLIEGSFPDYAAAFQVQGQYVLTVPTTEFMKAVDRVGVLIDDKVRAIHLTAQNNALTLSSGQGQMGHATEDMDAEFEHAEPLNLCFNARYLVDIAQHIDTDKMDIHIDSPDSPVLIRPQSELIRQSFIVMPMHV